MEKRIRFFSVLLCLLLVFSATIPSLAEVATLGVYFCGLTEKPDGVYEITPLEGKFDVYQDGRMIGTITSGKDYLMLTNMGLVTVIPVQDTMPEEWDVNPEGYPVQVTSSGTVTAPVMVFAKKTVQQESKDIPALIQNEKKPETTPEPVARHDNEKGKKTDISEQMPEKENLPAATGIPVPADTLKKVSDGGSLSVLVFNDKNGNGEAGYNEDPVAGVTVTVIAEDNTCISQVSADTGFLLFEGLPAGKYSIQVSLPAGYGFTKKASADGLNRSCMDTSTLGIQKSDLFEIKNDETTEKGVGVWQTPHASGLCWNDENADGVRQDDEDLTEGIKIEVRGQKNGLVYETVSGPDGAWYVDRLKPGFYDVYVYLPDGMMFTAYTAKGGDRRSYFTSEGSPYGRKTIDTNKGDSFENLNAGFITSGCIKGICFLDANYNGLFDPGEEPLPGVKLEALKQVSDDRVASTVSSADGTYILPSLRGRTYRVRAVLPEDGSTFTRVVSALNGNHFLSRPGRREYYLENLLLADGEQRELNVGAIYPGTVSGVAYLDNDFSGERENREETVSGLTVDLLDDTGGVVSTVRTNGKGRYTFEGLTPGTYQLSLEAKKGYAFTKHGIGNVILNTSGGAGRSEMFEVRIGESLNNMDLGMILPCTVSGQLFADANDNGLQDSGEYGLTEALVHLIAEDGTENFSMHVNPDASWCFDAVMPGTYFVRFELPENATFAKTVNGGNTYESDMLTAETDLFTMGSGGEYTAKLCGALTLGSVGGTAFYDENGNGVQDENESVLPGMNIRLAGTQYELETVSGPDGSFCLTGIHPGEYEMTVSFPNGYVLSRTDELALPLYAGETSETVLLQVPMGKTWEAQNIGCVLPAALTGYLWLDENNNGCQDEGEQTPAGEIVIVTDEFNNEVFAELKTDESGCFHTEGLIPGSFTLSYEPDSQTIGTMDGDSTFVSDGRNLVMRGIRVEAGETCTDPVLGIMRYTSLGGQVWLDQAGKTVCLPEVRIFLKSMSGDNLGSVETGEDGLWRFDGLLPDVYVISAELPKDHVVVEPEDERLDNGFSSILTEVSGRSGISNPIELRMGQDQLDLDIGGVQPGRLGDFCWLDENENGLQDSDEPGVPGVTIRLLRKGELVGETVSDSYGYYRFEELYPAVYSLQVNAPVQVKPTVKRTDIPVLVSVLDESAECEEILVFSNASNYNADMGFVLLEKGVLPAGTGDGDTQNWQYQ